MPRPLRAWVISTESASRESVAQAFDGFRRIPCIEDVSFHPRIVEGKTGADFMLHPPIGKVGVDHAGNPPAERRPASPRTSAAESS